MRSRLSGFLDGPQPETERGTSRLGMPRTVIPRAANGGPPSSVTMWPGDQPGVADQQSAGSAFSRASRSRTWVRVGTAKRDGHVELQLGQPGQLGAVREEVVESPTMLESWSLIGAYSAPRAVIRSAYLIPAYQRTECPRSIRARAMGSAGSGVAVGGSGGEQES